MTSKYHVLYYRLWMRVGEEMNGEVQQINNSRLLVFERNLIPCNSSVPFFRVEKNLFASWCDSRIEGNFAGNGNEREKKKKKRTVAIIFVSKMYLSLDWNRKSFFRVGKRGDEYNARFADERDGKANGRNKRIVSEITISNW